MNQDIKFKKINIQTCTHARKYMFMIHVIEI